MSLLNSPSCVPYVLTIHSGVISVPAELLKVVREIAAALAFLHQHDIVHFDIKPGNILVAPIGHAMIADLGFARDLSKLEPNSDLVVRFTKDFAHPSLLENLHQDDETSAAASSLGSQALQARIRFNSKDDIEILKVVDRFALGLTLFDILSRNDTDAVGGLSEYDKSYLELISSRLLDGHNEPHQLWEGLPQETLKSLHYRSTGELYKDVERLAGEYSLEKDIPELNPYLIPS